MTAYDWTLLAVLYFGIGNAWACADYCAHHNDANRAHIHPAAVAIAMVTLCLIHPLLFIVKLCRTKWVRCEA